MSRFGRNYLEVGLYTEIRFPELGVRFVAVNDGVDSDNQMDNDFTPFRNIMNEWYAKDTSKKIRAVLRSKGMAGKRIAVRAPYGYIRGADGNLIIDEEARPNVELIFQLCIEGNGPRKISRILAEKKIPSPATDWPHQTIPPGHPILLAVGNDCLYAEARYLPGADNKFQDIQAVI